MIVAANILTYLEMIPDPRTFRLRHRLVDVVAISILSKICGAEGWEDMQEFAESRKEWLETFMELPGGVPSSDTFRRIISHIEPTAFLNAFLEWMRAVQEILPELISIDGKTLRSAVKHGSGPLHIVSAWCEKNRMILGQVRNEAKSNEIAAIPELLKQLTLLAGCVITIDAAGAQKNIAAQIRDMGADYVLALKGNHQRLKDEIENYFLQAEEAGKEYAPLDEYLKKEQGHGRLECRKVFATDNLEWLEQKVEWRDQISTKLFRISQRGIADILYNQYGLYFAFDHILQNRTYFHFILRSVVAPMPNPFALRLPFFTSFIRQRCSSNNRNLPSQRRHWQVNGRL